MGKSYNTTMPRGPKKHLKRLKAPKTSSGPHKARESLPLIILLRQRLKYALNRREVMAIAMQRHIKVDGKVRTDINFPAGFMDVISIPACEEHYRLLYDVKGRFSVHRISAEEAKYKLCKVKLRKIGPGSVPFLVTHDGRTIRYPDPDIHLSDTVRIDIETGKILEFIKFDVGNLCMITGGRNLGRVGILEKKEKHPGSFDIAHIKDALGRKFATRADNVFVIGKNTSSLVSLPRRKGIKLTILEERDGKRKAPAPESIAA